MDWPPGRVPTRCLPHALAHVTIHLSVLRYNPSLLKLRLSRYNLLYRDTFSLSNLPPLSQYNYCIVTLSHAASQASLPLAIQTQGCHTIFFFLFAIHFYPLHIQRPKSRYKAFYYNTIWAVAQISPYTKIFSFFTIFFFNYFQLLENTNIYIYIYYHFPEHSNKFIKIYFIFF